MSIDEQTDDSLSEETSIEKTCFVIMPISDVDSYKPGHFKEVYDSIIAPVCKKAGFKPIRADDVTESNIIADDILRRLLYAEMAVCDLSTRNPNVLYELGIRHAFGRPVILIKDSKTPRIFDIQGIRDTPYNADLRPSDVKEARRSIYKAIVSTYDANEPVLLRSLNIEPAKPFNPTLLSSEATVLHNAIARVDERLSEIQQSMTKTGESVSSSLYKVGDRVMTDTKEEGVVTGILTSGELAITTVTGKHLTVSTQPFDPLTKLSS